MPLLGRVVALELLRRRDLGLLLAATAVLTLLVLGARLTGVENPETGTFLLNLSLGWSWTGTFLLTVLLAGRQLPQEIEQRTLHTLLARPVSRAQVVLAKWGASTLCGWFVFAALLIPGWLTPPHLEAYHPGLFAQALLAAAVGLAWVAAIALALSVLLPRALAGTLAVLLVFFSGQVHGGVHAWAEGRGFPGRLAAWLVAYLPDPGRCNLFTRYTDGLPPAGAGEFLGLLATATLGIAFFLVLALARFQRLRI
jgi:hypothetical protein